MLFQPRWPGPVHYRKPAAVQLDTRCGCAVISVLSEKRTARTRLRGRGHEARRAPSARQPHGFASGDKRGAAVPLI
jgi:hypothetical protein